LSAAEIRHLTYGQFYIARKEYNTLQQNDILNIDTKFS
jgi:hypothetical protein